MPYLLRRILGVRGAWKVVGAESLWAYRALDIIRQVEALSGDRMGYLRAGGELLVVDAYELQRTRPARPGWITAGCCEPGRIWVLDGCPPERTALAHEAAHLGLRRRSSSWWPLSGIVEPSEQACDEVARRVL